MTIGANLDIILFYVFPNSTSKTMLVARDQIDKIVDSLRLDCNEVPVSLLFYSFKSSKRIGYKSKNVVNVNVQK